MTGMAGSRRRRRIKSWSSSSSAVRHVKASVLLLLASGCGLYSPSLGSSVAAFVVPPAPAWSGARYSQKHHGAGSLKRQRYNGAAAGAREAPRRGGNVATICSTDSSRSRLWSTSVPDYSSSSSVALQEAEEAEEEKRAIETQLAAVSVWNAKAIKGELRRLKVDHDDCFEKEELAQRLAVAIVREIKQAQQKNDPVFQQQQQQQQQQARTSVASPGREKEATQGGVGEAHFTQEGLVCPMVKLTPSEGTLGHEVNIDRKDYFAMYVDLPDLTGGARTLFVLDTAATHTLMTPTAAQRLQAKTSGMSASATGGTTNMGGLKHYNLGRIQIAGQSCGTLGAVVMELPIADDQGDLQVSGILGLDFLSRYDICMDFVANTLTLAPAGSAKAGGRFGIKPPSLTGSSPGKNMYGMTAKLLPPVNFLGIDASLVFPENYSSDPSSSSSSSPSTATINTIVDTGSAFTIVNWAGAATAGLSRTDRRLRNTGQVVAGASAPGQEYQPVEVMEAELTLLLGNDHDRRQSGVEDAGVLKRQMISIGDLPGFAGLGMTGPTMILGTDIIKQGSAKMVMSFYDRKLWLGL